MRFLRSLNDSEQTCSPYIYPGTKCGPLCARVNLLDIVSQPLAGAFLARPLHPAHAIMRAHHRAQREAFVVVFDFGLPV
jgi:hypothetical protein